MKVWLADKIGPKKCWCKQRAIYRCLECGALLCRKHALKHFRRRAPKRCHLTLYTYKRR